MRRLACGLNSHKFIHIDFELTSKILETFLQLSGFTLVAKNALIGFMADVLGSCNRKRTRSMSTCAQDVLQIQS